MAINAPATQDPASALRTSIKISARTLLILGIVFVVLGFLAIILPVVASFVVTSFVGWLLVIGGVLYGYHAFGIRDGWNIAATLLLSLLTLASGVILLIFPIAGVITLTMFLAAYFIAAGILKAIYALQHRGTPSWGWALVSGVISIALGAIIWSGFPGTALWALGVIIGIDLIFYGWALIFLYSTLKRVAAA
jgi:uncharacterized membrane protein HdeD (DUF308 family)